MSSDPWAEWNTKKASDADDEFDIPQTTYLELKDLADHLIVIHVNKLGTKQGDGEYGYADCDVIVVDGEPVEPFLPTVPGVVLGMHISATAVFNALERHHRAKPGRPFLCRPDAMVNKRKQVVMGVRKHEVTDADKAKARGPWREYQSKNTPF